MGGLMSEASMMEVLQQSEALTTALRATGTTLKDPFLTLAFLPLAVIPEARLTLDGFCSVRF
jgi:adenine deaminase